MFLKMLSLIALQCVCALLIARRASNETNIRKAVQLEMGFGFFLIFCIMLDAIVCVYLALLSYQG